MVFCTVSPVSLHVLVLGPFKVGKFVNKGQELGCSLGNCCCFHNFVVWSFLSLISLFSFGVLNVIRTGSGMVSSSVSAIITVMVVSVVDESYSEIGLVMAII